MTVNLCSACGAIAGDANAPPCSCAHTGVLGGSELVRAALEIARELERFKRSPEVMYSTFLGAAWQLRRRGNMSDEGFRVLLDNFFADVEALERGA